jgi:hypothetical protein
MSQATATPAAMAASSTPPDHAAVGPDAEPRDRFNFSSPLGLIIGAAVLLVLSAVTAAAVNILLHSTAVDGHDGRVVAAYAGYMIPVLLGVIAAAMLIIGSVRWALFGVHGHATGLLEHQQAQQRSMDMMNQRLLLSETAKRIAYRDQDVELLRRTIANDVRGGQFDSAQVLVNEMATTYGLKEEAETHRERITQAAAEEREAKVTAGIARLQEILARHDFPAAAREANRLKRLYPEHEKTQDLQREVAQAREKYKQDLERQFLEAAQRDDVDKAVVLLEQLDQYLTPQEAEPFRETARGVIGKKRDNLGVQFKLAVHDKEWLAAVRVGEQIIREFPNSRMADEVRGMMDALRQRAAEQRAAADQRGTADRGVETRTRAGDQPDPQPQPAQAG